MKKNNKQTGYRGTENKGVRKGNNIDKMRRKLMKVGVWTFPVVAQALILKSKAIAQTPCDPENIPGSPVFRKIRIRKERKKQFRRLRILGEDKEKDSDTYPMEEEEKRRKRKKRKTWIDDF